MTEGEFNTHVGLRLKAARVRAGMTQTDLADVVGLTRTSVTNIEAGRQSPGAYRLHLLAVAVHSTIQELLSEVPAVDATEVLGLPRRRPVLAQILAEAAETNRILRAMASRYGARVDDEAEV